MPFSQFVDDTEEAVDTYFAPITVSGGAVLHEPDGLFGDPHLVVEAPPAPVAFAVVDISVAGQFDVPLQSEGAFIPEQVIVAQPDGEVGAAALTLAVMKPILDEDGEPAQAEAYVIAAALDLSPLANRDAYVSHPIALQEIARWPSFRVTVTTAGEGSVIVALYGKLFSLQDHRAFTYDPRLVF